MIRIVIKDLSGKIIGGFDKETIEEANEYLALIDAKERPWHTPKEGYYKEPPFGMATCEEVTIVDEPEYIKEEFAIDENGDQIIDQIITITIPAKTHIEYYLPKHYTVEIKDISEQLLKEKLLTEAYNYLLKTDFYHIRKLEINEEIPSEVLTKRIESRNFIRDNSNS